MLYATSFLMAMANWNSIFTHCRSGYTGWSACRSRCGERGIADRTNWSPQSAYSRHGSNVCRGRQPLDSYGTYMPSQYRMFGELENIITQLA